MSFFLATILQELWSQNRKIVPDSGIDEFAYSVAVSLIKQNIAKNKTILTKRLPESRPQKQNVSVSEKYRF
jgi:hypothetical protein